MKQRASRGVEVFPGIVQDPDVRFGKPCLSGTRIDVSTILGALSAGDTVKSICKNYGITPTQLQSVLRYASHIAEFVPPVRKSAA